MTLAQRLGTAAVVVVTIGVGLSPAAEAHRDHHHNRHSHKKQKAYNKGYRRGYRQAIENSSRHHIRPSYRNYSPVYGPMVSPVPRRFIAAPAPWMVPVHPYHHGNRVSHGFGFNL